MPRDPKTKELFDYVLENIPTVPLTKRARLYRALADLIGDEKEARSIIAIADDLEAIEARHDQLLLKFRKKQGAS